MQCMNFTSKIHELSTKAHGTPRSARGRRFYEKKFFTPPDRGLAGTGNPAAVQAYRADKRGFQRSVDASRLLVFCTFEVPALAL